MDVIGICVDVLDRLPVDECAATFGHSLTAALDDCEARGAIAFKPLSAVPFSADNYVKAATRQKPVLFAACDHDNRCALESKCKRHA
eukprot:1194195-Prorocentrum_minimum.AAC.5